MKYIFLTVLVILTACQQNAAPENLLSKEEMVAALTEIHMLEAKIKNVSIRPADSTQVVYAHYEALLFEDLGISEEEYINSFNYYVDHPNEFTKIYDAVVDTLMQREKLAGE